MKTQAVKGFFAAAAAVVLAVTPLAGRSVTIDVTKFQQRYPWNGLVDIDYTITRSDGEATLDPAKHFVEISVVNCAVTPATTNVAHIFRQQTLPVSDGAHRVTWDANAERVNFKSQSVKVFAEIVHYAEKYMVIDVSTGSGDDAVYEVTYLNGVPEGGFNKEEYKGDKIVLRLIPPGSFVMGSPTTETGHDPDQDGREVQHAVAITRPFYIGVFEITQKQYKNVMNNADPSKYKGDCRPVEQVTYDDIRGTEEGAKWPQTNSVDATSFIGRLRAKCREKNPSTGEWEPVSGLFDLPTDAQWEYACRAGTTTPLNDGGVCANMNELMAHFNNLGLYDGNSNKSSANVGTRASNAWGLYDMHGNVWEWCLDWYQADVQNIKNPSLDPVGPSAGADPGPNRVMRGGSFLNEARHGRSAYRFSALPSTQLHVFGFRLSSSLP